MKRLHVSSRAYADVVSARLYIAEHNPRAATRFWKKMRAQWRMLRRFPEAGRLRPEYAPGLRSIVVEQYLILYQLRAPNKTRTPGVIFCSDSSK